MTDSKQIATPAPVRAKRRTKYDRDYDIFKRIQERIFRIYQTARERSYTWEQLQAGLSNCLWNSGEFHKLSRHWRENLIGYDPALSGILKSEWRVFRYE